MLFAPKDEHELERQRKVQVSHERCPILRVKHQSCTGVMSEEEGMARKTVLLNAFRNVLTIEKSTWMQIMDTGVIPTGELKAVTEFSPDSFSFARVSAHLSKC